ncbi:MAG: alcohol dehydrogenase catalytic domain-containing protein [Roseinatronobacter sp.]
MPALVYTGPIALRFDPAAPIPVPGPGEVLVRVVAVGICGSDMHAYHGHDSRRPAPLILGHEAAGFVCGGPRDGQRVTIDPLVTDPDGPEARAGRAHLSPGRQIISMPPHPGAFAGFVTIPERNLHVVPDSLTLDQAALCEPVAVSWHALKQGLRLLGDLPALTMVQGGGAIGLAAALCARHLAGDMWLLSNPMQHAAR